jgi:HEAT repeat protein
LVSDAAFNAFVESAFRTAVVLLALSVVLMLLSLRLRRGNAVTRLRRAHAAATWRAIFARSIEADGQEVPPLAAADEFAVLRLWNDFNERRRGEETVSPVRRARLAAAALRARLDVVAIRYVEHGDAPEKILGATTLGHLGDRRAAPLLRALARDRDGDVSIAAARALLKIDPRSSGEFIASVRDRLDWSPTRVERVLREAAEVLAPEFPSAVRFAKGAARIRLLRYAPILGPEATRAAVSDVLAQETEPETIAAALRGARSCLEPGDLPALEAYARHPVAGVRVQAINAIGRIATPAARELLVESLRDADAWVRLRAAQGLVAAGAASEPEAALALAGGDRYGREMLAYALEGAATIDAPPALPPYRRRQGES